MPKQESNNVKITKKKNEVVQSIRTVSSLKERMNTLSIQHNQLKNQNGPISKSYLISLSKEMSEMIKKLEEFDIKFIQLKESFDQLEESLLQVVYTQKQTISLLESPSGVFCYKRDVIHDELNKNLF